MLEGKLGAEGSYKVEFIGGNIVVMAQTQGAHGAADLTISLALSEMLKEVASKSDNKWDDALVEFLLKQAGL
jgi:hypothetical protein